MEDSHGFLCRGIGRVQRGQRREQEGGEKFEGVFPGKVPDFFHLSVTCTDAMGIIASSHCLGTAAPAV